jgi:hypothetical protein
MKKKYKLKLEKIYMYNKKIKVSYTIYEKKDRKYTLCATGAGVPLKEFFIYWFECNFKHQFNIRF